MLLYRTDLEKLEYEQLSPLAMHAADSLGRVNDEEKCVFRTDFQRDRDRIVHSKAFRRLMHKTQVFIAPEGDHYRTRLTHTLEVAQISRTIAKILNYNETLTEAIALGHDLGHTPFGHNGEYILNDIHPGGFKHNEQSLRIADYLEKGSRRRGLNLTLEVRDGILNHTGDTTPMTLEGQIVKISDRIAYVNHDIDDAIRSGVLDLDDIPKEYIDILGKTHRERINNLIVDLCESSDGKENISMSEEYQKALLGLRKFLFENLYTNKAVKTEEYLNRVESVIKSLYKYYNDHPDDMPGIYTELIEEWGIPCVVKDYISGMTDRFALSKYAELLGK